MQHERDGDLLKAQGFTNITSLSLEKPVEFEGIILNKTGGSHGTTEMYAVPQLAEILDEAMGVTFKRKTIQRFIWLVTQFDCRSKQSH